MKTLNFTLILLAILMTFFAGCQTQGGFSFEDCQSRGLTFKETIDSFTKKKVSSIENMLPGNIEKSRIVWRRGDSSEIIDSLVDLLVNTLQVDDFAAHGTDHLMTITFDDGTTIDFYYTFIGNTFEACIGRDKVRVASEKVGKFLIPLLPEPKIQEIVPRPREG